MPSYNRYPAVDETFNFPPEVRAAFSESEEFLYRLLAIFQSNDSPLPAALQTALNQAIVDPESPFAQFVASYVSDVGGSTGADGATGPQGSGVGPVLLGETIITQNSPEIGSVSTNWPAFFKTVTKGQKPYCVKISGHVKPTGTGTMVIGIVDENDQVVQIWNHATAASGVAHAFTHETYTLNPPAGNHTYRVMIRITSGTVQGIATSIENWYPAYIKVIEQ